MKHYALIKRIWEDGKQDFWVTRSPVESFDYAKKQHNDPFNTVVALIDDDERKLMLRVNFEDGMTWQKPI